MARYTRITLLVLALGSTLLAACKSREQRAALVGGRFIILGFDGVDPQRVQTLIARGQLPALAAMGQQGHRGPLQSTNPPQSPVAWSAFATGLPAGHHGIFDFVGRNPRTYFPEIATTKILHASIEGEQLNPAEAENLRVGESFWDVLARQGIKSTALQVPYSYPPPESGARSLSGLGAPDVRGSNSSFTLLTTDKIKAEGPPPAGGQYSFLEKTSADRYQAMVEGPVLKINGKRTQTFAPVLAQVQKDGAILQIGGHRVDLKIGETSNYVLVDFVPDAKLSIRAATRVTLLKLFPQPEFYLQPLGLYPAQPYLPVSSPPHFAVDLWNTVGPFKTVGWVHDTSALGAGAMDESQFLREAWEMSRWRKAALLRTLREERDRLVVSVFTAPDRIGHMFYRYVEKDHPAASATTAEFAAALDQSYVDMDGIVALVQKELHKDDVVCVMSDHGFSSFRRGFNMNRWLLDKGYLALKEGVQKPRDFFADVDWSRTQAYALGTGGIYLNVAGREGAGIVAARDSAALAEQIAKEIAATKDGGTQAVLAAYLGDLLYKGPKRSSAPDVRVALAPGYRASWATSLGGIPSVWFEDNTRKWSGDHASARPEDVPGILVCNKKVQKSDPRLEDLSATAFSRFGLTPAPETIGRPLF